MNSIKNLIDQAISQDNCISYLDVLKYIPPDQQVKNVIDDIIGMLNDIGIKVIMENADIIELPRDRNDKE